ncbi:RepA [Nomiamastrel virus]
MASEQPESSNRSRAFRICAKNIFLTYPQCPLEKNYVLERLQRNPINHNLSFACVAKEEHMDGNTHLHCLLMYSHRLDIKYSRQFDIHDYHPNIQAARSPGRIYQYITKGGDVIEGGIKPPNLEKDEEKTPKKNRGFRYIMQHASTPEEFIQGIKEVYPYEYSSRLRWFQYAADHLYPQPPQVYQPPPQQFVIPDQLKSWADENLFTVSKESASLLQISVDDLKWMEDLTGEHISDEYHRIILPCDESPSILWEQQEPARHPGPEAWDDIITGTPPLTSQSTTSMPPSM